MENQIKEVQNYFKSKLLSGDFEVKKIERHTLGLVIDGKYKFDIWIANFDIKDSVKPYESNATNFIQLPFTVKDSLKLRSVLKPIIVAYHKDVLEKEKLAKYKKLKKELGF